MDCWGARYGGFCIMFFLELGFSWNWSVAVKMPRHCRWNRQALPGLIFGGLILGGMAPGTRAWGLMGMKLTRTALDSKRPGPRMRQRDA